jgi:MFS transporter, FHS family, Na+ dependent glucose transporter 1
MAFSRFRRIKSNRDLQYFFSYGIGLIALGLASAAIGPILPSLAVNVDVSLAQISFVFTTSSLGYLIGSAGGGRLFDRFNGHRLMLIAVILLMVSYALIPITDYYMIVLIIMFFFGIGMGLIDVGANVNLLWIFQSRVGPYMNALHFCFGVGAFLSPILIHQIMQLSAGSLTWPLWTLMILTMPSIIGLWRLPNPQNPEIVESKNSPKPGNLRLVILMVVLFFLYVGVEGGFGGWIFTYVTASNLASDTGAAYINAIFWGALTLGRLLSVPLARKVALSKLLLANFILSIGFLGLILLFPVHPIMIWISSAGLGMALSSVFPTLLALAESRMNITGAVTGYFFLGSSLGSMIVPTLLGQIFEYIGSFEIMVALFGLSCLGLIILISVNIVSKKVGEKMRV